jgi:hypothetical protein
LINKFNVKPEDVDNNLLNAWAADVGLYLKQKPGFISTQLHRGIIEEVAYLSIMQYGSL